MIVSETSASVKWLTLFLVGKANAFLKFTDQLYDRVSFGVGRSLTVACCRMYHVKLCFFSLFREPSWLLLPAENFQVRLFYKMFVWYFWFSFEITLPCR